MILKASKVNQYNQRESLFVNLREESYVLVELGKTTNENMLSCQQLAGNWPETELKQTLASFKQQDD